MMQKKGIFGILTPNCQTPGRKHSHGAKNIYRERVQEIHRPEYVVSALTGHKPGSSAFARYRDIDDDMKQEMVDAID